MFKELIQLLRVTGGAVCVRSLGRGFGIRGPRQGCQRIARLAGKDGESQGRDPVVGRHIEVVGEGGGQKKGGRGVLNCKGEQDPCLGLVAAGLEVDHVSKTVQVVDALDHDVALSWIQYSILKDTLHSMRAWGVHRGGCVLYINTIPPIGAAPGPRQGAGAVSSPRKGSQLRQRGLVVFCSQQ